MQRTKPESKLAIFIVSSALAGAEKRFIRIASEMTKLREDMLLIINKDLYEATLKDNEIKERINKLDKSGKLEILDTGKSRHKYIDLFFNYINLYKILKRNNVKILHCSLAALRYALIKKVIKLKVIGEITSPDVARDIRFFTKYRLVVSSFDKIIAVSEGVKDRTIKSLEKINKHSMIEKITYLSIPYYHPPNGLNELSWSEKENLIVYASRFVERKNPLLFAEVILKFLNENQNWKVAILGSGPLEKEIKVKMENLLREGRVFIGYTTDIYGYLKRSKIFVSLIYPDNYPSQSIMEAMNMKNAILATNVGNTYKLVTEKNGFLAEDYEINTISKTLDKAALDQERLKNMGEQSKKLIEERFSKDIYLSELQYIYNSID